jgi:hypothetical protein
MRKRLAQVRHALEADDDEQPMDTVVRRFWSRTRRPAQGHGPTGVAPHAQVVDLALARQARALRTPER